MDDQRTSDQRRTPDQHRHDPERGSAEQRDEDLAQALDEDARERAADPRRRLWTVYLPGLVVLVVAVLVVLLWPSSPPPSGPGGPSTTSSSTPGGADVAGADLLTAPWPSSAVTALRHDVGLKRVSRVLLTRTQVQATGPASGDGPGHGAWSDYVYVQDTAIDLGDALVAPTKDDLFRLGAFDATAIPGLVTRAPGLTGAPADDDVYVLVSRDTVTEGSPVRIQVFLSGDGDSHVVTADAYGTVLDAD